jgi:hypothetical protein
MSGIAIYPRGSGMFAEIGDACDNLHAPPEVPVAIGAFETHDEARVLIALPMPHGRWLTAEVSLALLLTAADAFAQAHGDPRSSDTCLRCGVRRIWR